MPGRQTVYRGPRLTIEFELNLRGIRQIAVSPRLREVCHDVAQNRALPFAIVASPVGRTREYVRSWVVVDGSVSNIGKPPMRRAASFLVNLSDHAKLVEVGNQRFRGHYVLRRTAFYLSAGRRSITAG